MLSNFFKKEVVHTNILSKNHLTMLAKADKQSFLIVTNTISKQVIRLYNRIKEATADIGDVFILYHTCCSNKMPPRLRGIKIKPFGNEILNDLGYTPVRQTLVPGSNHFPVLKFYLEHPHYSHYWCLEDDVALNGKWKNFYKNFPSNLDYDFITSHIRRHSDIPEWYWWDTFQFPKGELDFTDMYSSFNPIYRISNKAIRHIDFCLKNGYSGHHEVLVPTLLQKEGFRLADFATTDNCITPKLSYCTLGTMRWKPVFLTLGKSKNKLYHPVKSSITFRQILVLIKRTLLNQTHYFE